MRTEAQRENPSTQIGSSCREFEFTEEKGGPTCTPPPPPPVEEDSNSTSNTGQLEPLLRGVLSAAGLGGLSFAQRGTGVKGK